MELFDWLSGTRAGLWLVEQEKGMLLISWLIYERVSNYLQGD